MRGHLPIWIAVLLAVAGLARADSPSGPWQDCDQLFTRVAIDSDAMLPGFQKGERLRATCFTHAIRGSSLVAGQVRLSSLVPQLAAGDLVAFRDPDDTSRTDIRRVVAFPGDKVQLRDYRLVINDTVVPTVRVGDFTVTDSQGQRRSAQRLHEALSRHILSYDVLVPPEAAGGGTSDAIRVPERFILVFPDNRATPLDIARPGLRLVPLVNLIARVDTPQG